LVGFKGTDDVLTNLCLTHRGTDVNFVFTKFLSHRYHNLSHRYHSLSHQSAYSLTNHRLIMIILVIKIEVLIIIIIEKNFSRRNNAQQR
jgi:hypothetical protein